MDNKATRLVHKDYNIAIKKMTTTPQKPTENKNNEKDRKAMKDLIKTIGREKKMTRNYKNTKIRLRNEN